MQFCHDRSGIPLLDHCDRLPSYDLYNIIVPFSIYKQSELSVGTKVCLENTVQRERKGGKMDPVWLGPYIINRSVGKGLYELKNS